MKCILLQLFSWIYISLNAFKRRIDIYDTMAKSILEAPTAEIWCHNIENPSGPAPVGCYTIDSTLFYSTLLYSILLYSTVLYCAIRCYTVLYCAMLCYAILYYAILD